MYLVWFNDIEGDELLGTWSKRSDIPKDIKACPDVTIEHCRPDGIRAKDHPKYLAKMLGFLPASKAFYKIHGRIRYST